MNHLLAFRGKVRGPRAVCQQQCWVHPPLAALSLSSHGSGRKTPSYRSLAAEQPNCYYLHMNWRFFAFQSKIGFPRAVLFQPEQSVYCSIFFRAVFAPIEEIWSSSTSKVDPYNCMKQSGMIQWWGMSLSQKIQSIKQASLRSSTKQVQGIQREYVDSLCFSSTMAQLGTHFSEINNYLYWNLTDQSLFMCFEEYSLQWF